MPVLSCSVFRGLSYDLFRHLSSQSIAEPSSHLEETPLPLSHPHIDPITCFLVTVLVGAPSLLTRPLDVDGAEPTSARAGEVIQVGGDHGDVAGAVLEPERGNSAAVDAGVGLICVSGISDGGTSLRLEVRQEAL